VGNDGLEGANPSHVAGASSRIILDVPGGTVRGVGAVSMLDGVVINSVVDPVAELVKERSNGSGQVLSLSGELVVVVGLVQVAGLLASGASVHESLGHILLAFLANGAVQSDLGGMLVTEDLSLETDLAGLVAILTEGDGLIVGQVEDILAESVLRSLVPVADSPVVDGVVNLLVGIDAGASGGVLLNLPVSVVLGVPRVLGEGKSAVEVDERAILLFSAW